MPRTALSAAQARRIALAAQGFGDRAPTGPVTAAHLRRVVGRTRLLQMDSVNVAVRAHYLPVFSRLGPYDRGVLDRAAWRPSRRGHQLVEYWAHEAALIPVGDWPLFGWRREEFRDGRYRHTREIMRRSRSLAADVRAVVADTGPCMPRDIEARLGIERAPGRVGGWWQRGEVKHVCEAMFASGELSAVRDDHFHRHYDLAERVVGPHALDRYVARDDAHRDLTEHAAAALGVATVADLADYYRLKTAEVRSAVADLVEAGTLTPVTVPDWPADTYLHTGAAVPRVASRAARRSAILSPFDPLVFFRPRALRLFGFHYRIEIYVPEHKRVHGYYVHPYLMGDDIAARVDLKADRSARLLRVQAAHLEPDRDVAAVAASLATDLHAMAGWLGLDGVQVAGGGAFPRALRRAVVAL